MSLRDVVTRLASADEELRPHLNAILASESREEWAAIFDALRPGQTVHVAMRGVMERSAVTDGQYHPWKVGRRSKSKAYNMETITLMPVDGSKPPSKMATYALRKRGTNVSASLGDMALILVGIRPG